jgi:ribonuclease M5
MTKPQIREVIIVEGRYDKNAVSQVADAVIVETRGFGVFSDDELVEYIRRLGRERGVIILTDSDGAGFLIRGKLAGMLQGVEIKHAYIPDIPGLERRKTKSSGAGLLGVEGMGRETILGALRDGGATFIGSGTAETSPRGGITSLDLYELGLSGGENSSARREKLLVELGLPRLLKSRGLLDALNCLYSREEFVRLCGRIFEK